MENKKQQIENIKQMQKEKDVVILAHYYVDGAVQEIADFVGDSFYLKQNYHSSFYPKSEHIILWRFLYGRECEDT